MKKKYYASFGKLILIATLFMVSCKKEKKGDPEPAQNQTPPNNLGVTTAAPSSITGTRVTLSGEVTGDGGLTILERGFCGGNTPSPILQSNNKFKVSGGIGTYSTTYISLQPNTTYYIRSYVINTSDTAYGNEINFSTTDLVLGDFYEGGFVFYIDGTGDHGMVADSIDLPTNLTNYGLVSTFGGIVSTSSAFGTGQANTTAFVNYCTTNSYSLTNNAIGTSNNLSVRGYSDWYIPSYDELMLMYTNLKVPGYGNFRTANYWSSTANAGNPGNNVDCINFIDGTVQFQFQSNSYNMYARAVRSF